MPRGRPQKVTTTEMSSAKSVVPKDLKSDGSEGEQEMEEMPIETKKVMSKGRKIKEVDVVPEEGPTRAKRGRNAKNDEIIDKEEAVKVVTKGKKKAVMTKQDQNDDEEAKKKKVVGKGKKKEDEPMIEEDKDSKKKSARGKKQTAAGKEEEKDEEDDMTVKSNKKTGKKIDAKKEESDNVTSKKTVGRGKKIISTKEDEIEAVNEEEPVEKPISSKRGRKATVTESSQEQNGSSNVEEIVVKPPSKRGKKNASEPVEKENGSADVEEPVTKPVSKRGKKATPAVETPEPIDEQNGSADDEEVTSKPAGKRGKKITPEVINEENNGTPDVEEPVVKPTQKRGRKVAPVTTPEPSEEQNTPVDDDEVEKPLAKRGKKAPPKEKNISSEDADVEVNDEKEKPTRGRKATPKTTAEKKTKAAPKNNVITDLDSINFVCEKENAKGEKANMKICSWNVSGARAMSKKNGVEYLIKEDADVVILQETKATEEQIRDAIDLPGYKLYYLDSNKPGYCGIALYSKKEPIDVSYGLKDSNCNDEGRLITAEFDKFYILNVYVPNAGKGLSTMPKRLEWNKALKAYVKELDTKKPVIVCGDFNVAHEEIDLANPKTNTKNAGFTKEERDGMTDFLAAGFVDTFRSLYPDKTDAYTFWNYISASRAKNVGWRLDYFIVSKRILDNICDNVMRTEVYGSDHCPVVLYANI